MRWKSILPCLLFALAFLFFAGCDKKKASAPARPDLPTSPVMGLDWLALQHPGFNLGAALEELPPGRHAIGMLDTTFGDSLEPVRFVLGSGKVSHFRVHFINGPCKRNGQCGDYEIGGKKSIAQFNNAIESHDPTILDPFRERVRLFCGLMDEFPTVRFYFSWALEHNLSQPAYLTLNHVARKEACDRQDYFVVNNPVGSHIFPEWDLYEDHHHKFRNSAQVTSLDGEDIDQIPTAAWKQNIANSNAKLAFGWAWKYNCRVPGPFIDPRARTNCPTRDEHRHIIHRTFADPIPDGAAPPPSQGQEVKESWGQGNLWKPESESDDKLVILIRSGYSTEFESCKAPLKSGGWDTLNCVKGSWNNYQCKSNPDRLTYRGNHTCDKYKERLVVCNLGDFTLMLGGGGNVCQRAG